MHSPIMKLVFLIALFITTSASAHEYTTLYGFKIGQTLASVKEALGEPTKIIPFNDGWVAYAYRRQDHSVVFETNPSRPDAIISVQVTGQNNPEGYGLGHVNLGDSVINAKKYLGNETTRESAVDSMSGQPVPGVFINRYEKSLSFEETDGKISSIKLIFSGPAPYNDFPGITPLLKALKSKDNYAVCGLISSDLTIGGVPAIKGQILESIRGVTELNKILYDEKNGIVSIDEKDNYKTTMRVYKDGSGYAMKFENKYFESLVFIYTYQGWVLKEVW